jgi:alpha-beta hydrolase superfamily lysophospholipase
VGAVIAYFIRLGLVPISESIVAGMALSLGIFLLESAQELFGQVLKRSERNHRPSWRTVSFRTVVIVIFVAFLAPLEALHPLRTVPKRSPSVVGLPFEDVRFETRDGLQLAGWLVPHPQPRGNVIYCHGHGRNREQGTGFLQTLHGLNLNVLAFDFRSHGESSGHTATFGYHEVDDLLAAESFMRQRFPDQPLFIVGVSYGAAVTLQALPRLPNVHAVWLEGSFSRFIPVVENQFSMLPPYLRKPLISVYEVVTWLDCGFWGSEICPINQLKQVNVPIYFCHGMADELVPLSEGQALFAAYQGPKECYWVSGATHYDVRRLNKVEYFGRLEHFFSKEIEQNSGLVQSEPDQH